MAERTEIETFAFVDIETSGLPVYNFGKTSIAEISIQSCSRKDILECNKDEIPRCLDKLVLCFNPSRRIHPGSTNFSGLYNYMLDDHNPLNENAAELIVKFFQHLRHPVCLVAHYGNEHDYKIINKAFQKLQMVLPEEILCVDSRPAFKYIDDRINKTFDIESDEELEQWLYEEFDNNDSENMESLTQQRMEVGPSALATPKPKEIDSGGNSTVVTDGFDEVLPEEILCVDSLPAFKYIDQCNKKEDLENTEKLDEKCDIENDKKFQQVLKEEYANAIKKETDALETPRPKILHEDRLSIDSLPGFQSIDDKFNQQKDSENMENLLKLDIENENEWKQWLDEEYNNIIKKENDALATPKRTILAEGFINNRIHQHDDSENMENLTQQWLEEELANITKQEQNALAISEPKENDQGANCTVVTDGFDEVINFEKINETTPKRPIEPRLSSKFHTLKNSDHLFSTDRKARKFKRVLFPSKPKTNPKPYQLSSIYERCFGQKPKVLHRADDDVTALLKVVVFHGEEFVKYSQLYAKPISSVPALGRKL